ncbi:BREX-1 system phosphatase PglZ type B [Stieleria sp. ICT_E10.1]|uniref:BREX-1 system phosphatase PglZ type B n=1 Tax=Stieleria sedimenti TaxID=2976331 RepID=UPI0021804C5E|nr:BREX-1 system phosphatase PglZ type B [Stieleria sedimenti]MCS7466138.1 BREX-1 system phosphatase PglZ type B [Stieleria sedimenti]
MASENDLIVTHLIRAIRSAGVYNANVQNAPACILWPDGDRQWEPVVGRLQGELAELCVLGNYLPAERTGPAIWLRLVIADKSSDVKLPGDKLPILYLPGVRRQDLRAVGDCPEHLKPLAELQYRGVIWSQLNSKDWTISSFLQSNQGGLGLDVAQDNETKQAMRLALFRLLDERVDLLDGKRLDKDYFNKLLTSGDPHRDLLMWIDNPDQFRQQCDTNTWNAFVAICKSQLKFDPAKDGEIEAAERLAERAPPWNAVWQRYADAPKKYANIPAQIRKTKVTQLDPLFPDCGGWPQWNDQQEDELRSELAKVGTLSPAEARKQIRVLETQHGPRRDEVWAKLDLSPLATALEYLISLAEVTSDSLAAGTAADIAAAYHASGWRADDSMLRALAVISSDADLVVVRSVLETIYAPWATDAALHLQSVVANDGYPGRTAEEIHAESYDAGTCFLFVDGLRLDLAKRLESLLTDKEIKVDDSIAWSALPSVTATAKPAVTPVRHLIKGADVNKDFTPEVAATGKSLNGHSFQNLLEQEGWTKLGKSELGDPNGKAWTEIGDVDHEGHERGWKLARHIDSLLGDVVERISQLFDAGWKEIHVVTDHGWLLMPGSLPKAQLLPSLSENKWGRCAALKDGASSDAQLYPWFWNPTQWFAFAEGISCFYKNEYSHGGLSMQECVTQKMTLHSNRVVTGPAEIAKVEWTTSMRCKVTLASPIQGARLDIRTHAGNAESSEVNAVKNFKDGKTSCSVIIEDEDLGGHHCWVVVLDANGQPIGQEQTIVGGDN